MRCHFAVISALALATLALPSSAEETTTITAGEAHMVAIGDNFVINLSYVSHVSFRTTGGEDGEVLIHFPNGSMDKVAVTRAQWSKIRADLIGATAR